MCEKASHDQGRQLLRPATIHHCPTMLPATIRHYPRIDMGKHLCGGPSVAARNQSSVAAHNQHPPRRPCKSGSAGRLFMQVPHLRGACHVDRTLPAFTSGEKDPDSPIHVALFRPDAGTMTPPAPFAPPLDDAQLDDLRWYLEVLATWPTGPDYERAEAIEARLEDWGRALLAGVTADRDAARLWQQFVDAEAEGKLLTIAATDPRVLRLPWELLADEGGHLFTQGIGVRRRLPKVTTARG